MLKKIQRATASSPEGTRGLVRGVLACAAQNIAFMQSWFEGNYAYWNAAAIAVDYDQETMKNVIELFVTENLTEAE